MTYTPNLFENTRQAYGVRTPPLRKSDYTEIVWSIFIKALQDLQKPKFIADTAIYSP